MESLKNISETSWTTGKVNGKTRRPLSDIQPDFILHEFAKLDMTLEQS